MTELARRLPFMTSDTAPVAQARSVAGLTAFVALLAILAFVVETLSQVGVPAKILVWLVAGFALAVPAGVAIAARTISPGEFALAGRDVALGANASASAIAMFGGVFAIAIAAAFFRSEGRNVGAGARAVRRLRGRRRPHRSLFPPERQRHARRFPVGAVRLALARRHWPA